MIRNMYIDGRILHAYLNVLDTQNVERVVDWLQRNELKIDTVYASNIPEWIFRGATMESYQTYQDNMKLLSSVSDFIYIDAKKERVHEGAAPTQRMTWVKKNGEVPSLVYSTRKVRNHPALGGFAAPPPQAGRRLDF